MVIDHMARIDVREGLNGKAFTALRRLLDRGNVWVKLSGADRISMEPGSFADAVPFARALAVHAPERIVWGTDWPHPNHTAVPDDGVLVDLIAQIAPDARTRLLMLVDNPNGYSAIPPRAVAALMLRRGFSRESPMMLSTAPCRSGASRRPSSAGCRDPDSRPRRHCRSQRTASR